MFMNDNNSFIRKYLSDTYFQSFPRLEPNSYYIFRIIAATSIYSHKKRLITVLIYGDFKCLICARIRFRKCLKYLSEVCNITAIGELIHKTRTRVCCATSMFTLTKYCVRPQMIAPFVFYIIL